jgi:hypothetical protein
MCNSSQAKLKKWKKFVSKFISKLINVVKDPTIIRNKIHQNRRLSVTNSNAKGTHSSRRVNYLLAILNSSKTNYLEIGIAHGYTIEAVEASKKIGIDPFLKCKVGKRKDITLYEETSEKYFNKLTNEKFDVIFIDGSHTFREAYFDLINSINSLKDEGFILMDDTVPEDKFSALSDHELCNSLRKRSEIDRETWSGDVYKVILALNKYHKNLVVKTIISPQHPQSVIFKLKPSQVEQKISEDQLFEFSNTTFDEIFEDFKIANSVFNFGLELNIMRNLGFKIE